MFIWRQVDGTWTKIKEHLAHTSSGGVFNLSLVNSVAWAPHEYGLVLAAGSSDGKVSIISYKGFYFINSFLLY